MAALLLVAAVGAYGWFVGGWPKRRAGHRYWRSLWRAGLAFGASAMLIVALLGRLGALLVIPAEFEPVAALLLNTPGFRGDPTQFQITALAGLAGGAAIGAAVAAWRLRRGKDPHMFGDVRAVLPRGRGEILPAALVGVSAAIVEELYFRLALPLLVALVTGSALAGFALSALLFSYAHRYQRWRGMVATGLAGLLQTAMYLVTGSIGFAILVHALINLNGLALRPLLFGNRRD
jgi:membrane protease YdiL (CAAX protease family)